MDACVPPLMVETDHAFDKNNHVGTDRGVVGPGISQETLVAARLRTIGASFWRAVASDRAPPCCLREGPPAAGNDRAGDVLM
jgi:hypothetical protein